VGKLPGHRQWDKTNGGVHDLLRERKAKRGGPPFITPENHREGGARRDQTEKNSEASTSFDLGRDQQQRVKGRYRFPQN